MQKNREIIVENFQKPVSTISKFLASKALDVHGFAVYSINPIRKRWFLWLFKLFQNFEEMEKLQIHFVELT